MTQDQIVGPPTAIKPDGAADVEKVAEVDKVRPAYLDEAILNVNACCPSFMFKYCPCLVCSFFSVIINVIIDCFKGICGCIKACCLSIKKCFKDCFTLLCNICMMPFRCVVRVICKPLMNCFIKLCKFFKDCMLKLCSPCIKIFRCILNLVLKCLSCLNICNVECGLPCRNPPGCVCIFPCKLCGFGFTCPYSCFSCGWKHCIKMPANERAYWQGLRQKPPTKEELKKMAEEKKQKAMAPNQTEMSTDVEKGLRQEIADLKLQLEAKQLQAGGGEQVEAAAEAPTAGDSI